MKDANLKTLSPLEVLYIYHINFIGFDTTLISEIEYINILPDMMELDDSSFLKSSFVNGNAANKNGDLSKIEANAQENEE